MAKPAGRAFQIRYFSLEQNREVRISTETHDADEAADFKKNIEAKLLLGIEVAPKRVKTLGPAMPWSDFREEYSRLKVATMRSENAAESAEYRLDVCEAVMQPRTLGQMANPSNLATLQARLLAGVASKKSCRSPHTVKGYMATLIAALNWAHRPMHWLPAAVEFDLLDTDDPAKGRPLCGEEFDRMIAAIPKVLVGEGMTADAGSVESWQLLLRGLWESGLRLSEAMALHWDAEGAIVPRKSRGGLLLLSIPAKMQKSRKALEAPTTPAFTALLEGIQNRTGWIFNPPARRQRRGQGRLTAEHVGRIITLFGIEAKVKVNAEGKPASAHDLRRSFGQRMADAGLPPRDLQAIMRHASFTTTEAYYLRDRAQDQGQRIAAYLGTGTKKPAAESSEPSVASH